MAGSRSKHVLGGCCADERTSAPAHALMHSFSSQSWSNVCYLDAGHEGSAVALVGGEVVALAVLDAKFDRDVLRSEFDLDSAFPPADFPPGSLGRRATSAVPPGMYGAGRAAAGGAG